MNDLEQIKMNHFRGGYQHREGCGPCWLITEIERLKAELAEAQKDNNELDIQVDRLRDEKNAEEDKAEKLREALRRYGRHNHSCKCQWVSSIIGITGIPESECDCGWKEAATLVEEK